MAPPLCSGTRLLLLVGAALILLQHRSATVHGAGAGNSSLAMPNCPDKCPNGNVSIPYPFGIGPGCFFSKDFEVTCKNGTAFIGSSGDDQYTTTAALLYFDLPNGEARIQSTVQWSCNYTNGTNTTNNGLHFALGQSLKVSYAKNKFTAIGCATIANIEGSTDGTIDFNDLHYSSACASFCDSQYRISKSSDCDGLGCCQTSLPEALGAFQFGLFHDTSIINNPDAQDFSPCSYVFIVEGSAFKFDPSYAQHSNFQQHDPLPMVLDWTVGSQTCDKAKNDNSSPYACRAMNSICINATNGAGYRCNCSTGFQGNPYLEQGCQDINECEKPSKYPCNGKCKNTIGGYSCSCPAGTMSKDPKKAPCNPIPSVFIGIGIGGATCFISLVLIAIFLTKRSKRRRARKLKQKFFTLNRGQLLKQLVSQRADIAERMIITLDELEKATNKFDVARELGGGGHGTVYKGILSDLHVVAIKKSNIVVQKEIDEFINEVAILSQINHRNIVKLIGCCLETEVPLLVYEFISNGTLYHHLHVAGPKSLSWGNRLRIAAEIANALSYLHSSVSVPIIHRDIKSNNILLDDSLTSKVSDFGASRYIPIEKSGLTTMVQGTFGYLDPMYFYTCRLNDKSDVYSFGVVLVELLTRRKTFPCTSEDEGLVADFASLHGAGNLVQILDPQVIEEGGKEVLEVAQLAASCIKLRGEDRPTMRQVNRSLEVILTSKKGYS